MKAPIVVSIVAIAMVTAGWAFFTFGGTPAPQLLSSEQQAILKVHDERLSKGSPGAPVKIIDYVDVLCPFCAKSNQPGETVPRIMSDYVDTKKAHYEVRLVAKTAQDSERAGKGAYCAAEQNKFWEYLDTAYSDTWKQYYSQNKDVADVTLFQKNTILSFAKTIPGLDTLKWQECLHDNDYTETMNTNANDMTELGAYGTPTMVVDGKSYSGTPPYSSFQAIINASLNQKKQEAASAKAE